ncbi:IS200/IS605 family transposase [Tenacibaculum sp. M341]|uniref:IS200/IS605 family transposase n=1 Tax=Tenacibaculum sp. M341 TaxID=2530339 RepID=UPI0010521B7C|nr:IS200/IS605 family transposase [Tenacibaculum sp. M341]TCI84588.1 IS200/IS605 family transposase [Tenacibaculum sp. M341]
MERLKRKGSHTVSRLTFHIVWVTKYCYQILKGDIQVRCRELLMQICDAENVSILKGVISSDHIHMYIEYVPKQSVSYLVKQLKGRSSRKLQQEFRKLSDLYWGKHFWGVGYGVWSTGNITNELLMILYIVSVATS